MQTHMRAMESMSGDQLKAMVATHRQMVANMLSSFDNSMQRMNMPSDSARTALRDSIRQDLIYLPELSVAQLKSSMPKHASRLARFMRMHAQMMGMKR